MQEEGMILSVKELESRIEKAKGRFELLRLREDITAFIKGPQIKELSQEEKNQVEDMLVKVIAKEEQFKGCDPWKSILGHK